MAKRPRCRTCLYFKYRPRPDLKKACVAIKRKPNMPACTRFYRPALCLDCAYFVMRTCRRRREPKAFDLACTAFLDRQALRVKDRLPRLADAEDFLKDGFREILSKVFAIEKASTQALQDIQQELEKQGVIVPFNHAQYTQTVSLITRIYLLNQVAQLCGLGHLLDYLLEYELGRLSGETTRVRNLSVPGRRRD